MGSYQRLLSAIEDKLRFTENEKVLIELESNSRNWIREFKEFKNNPSSEEEAKKERIQNFNFLMKNFGEYFPNFKLKDFKLNCWRGNIFWGEAWGINSLHFDSANTPLIILWIIKNYGIDRRKIGKIDKKVIREIPKMG